MNTLRQIFFGWSVHAAASALISTAMAQSPTPLATTNVDLVTNGTVLDMARQPDGGLVLAGRFSKVNGVPRANLARLRPDGSVDPNWNPTTDNSVTTLVIGTDGYVYVGGNFAYVNGVLRHRLAKISPNGTVDPDWDPAANWPSVNVLAGDGHGSLYVGGSYSLFGTEARSNLAKVSMAGTGAVDATWAITTDGPVHAIAVDTTGNVFVGGEFSTVGGTPHMGVAKLSGTAAGSVDATWGAWLGPCCSSRPWASVLALDSFGSLYVGGYFESVNGVARSGLAKLSTAGVGLLDASWDPGPGSLSVIAIWADSAVYVGGYFNSIGGQPVSHLAKLSASGVGAADPTWNPSPNRFVSALVGDGNGGVQAAGAFYSIGGAQHIGLAEVTSSGTIGNAADVEQVPAISAVAVQPDGGTLLAGDFVLANGVPRPYLVRLMAGGAVDPDWNPQPDSYVWDIAVENSGAVFVVGGFATIGAQSRNGIAKLSGSGSGTVEPTWNPQSPSPQLSNPRSVAVDNAGSVFVGDGLFDGVRKFLSTGMGGADPMWQNPVSSGSVGALLLDGNGSIFLGGLFSSVGGQAQKNVAKVSASTGVLDPSWRVDPDGSVTAIAKDAQGALYIGGNFYNVGAQPRRFVAKVAMTGTGDLDLTWDAGMDISFPNFPFVSSILPMPSGAVLVGGAFTTVGNQFQFALAKVSGHTGAPDPQWKPAPNGTVSSLEMDAAGGVLVGGSFSNVGGQSRDGFAVFGDYDHIFAHSFE